MRIFSSFFCLDMTHSTIPVENWYISNVNFKKNIADDFREGFEKHKQRKKLSLSNSFGARALSLLGGDDR